MRKSSRQTLAIALIVVALGLMAVLAGSLLALHDRLAAFSRPLAVGLVAVVIVAAVAAAVASARLLWKLGRSEAEEPRAPEDIVRAAEVQAEEAGKLIAQVRDQSARSKLEGELARIRADRRERTFRVVVFGTGSAGKTSLINALLGTEAGAVAATMGTTRHGTTYTHAVEGLEGRLELIDTPGLSEIGQAGAWRETEARDLAARADLLLFVVDHDLTRSEFEPLADLARQGKRAIVVLNKKDRFPRADREAILARLRERLRGIVPSDEVAAVAAAPKPTPVRIRNPDGSIETVLEVEPPDLADLADRIARIIEAEGDALRAANLLLRAHLVGREARDRLTLERREKARAVVEKFQWITAGTVFANPIPALDLMATGAVQFQMVSEIASAFGVELAIPHAKMIAGQMIQTLLKLGLVEAATSLIAGVFKSSFVGFAAGGAIQATSMAYLTHISGLTFLDYFERGQSWGDGGIQAALVRQFDLHSRTDFLREFAGQAVERVLDRMRNTTEPSGPGR